MSLTLLYDSLIFKHNVLYCVVTKAKKKLHKGFMNEIISIVDTHKIYTAQHRYTQHSWDMLLQLHSISLTWVD